jgi:23S rRNA pseudouridine1911/1915/1917 synthase
LRAWIDAGQLTVGGQEAKPRLKLKGGEELELDTELEAASEPQPEPIPLAVVHADDALLVIDKPVGLVVHPGAGNRSGTLQNALLHRYPELAVLPRAGLVHRLDKDTSGLLLVARTLQSQTALAAALERREIKRTYRGICQGVLTGGGTVDAPIGRHRRERTKMAVTESGRPARTHYRVIERFRAHTYCEIELETGRTHQIRVHMAHIRAPLLGDPVYGGRPKLPPAASVELCAALQGFRRQALHASRLNLTHPATGAPLAFDSELAPDLAALLPLLRADVAGGGR